MCDFVEGKCDFTKRSVHPAQSYRDVKIHVVYIEGKAEAISREQSIIETIEQAK